MDYPVFLTNDVRASHPIDPLDTFRDSEPDYDSTIKAEHQERRSDGRHRASQCEFQFLPFTS